MQTITEDYLRQHRARGGTANTWKSICPDCGNNNLYYTSHNGFAYCFNCGSAFTTSKREYVEEKEKDVKAIRGYYRKIQREYAGYITKEHEQYFERRGIDRGGIELFKLGYCPPSSLEAYFDPVAKEAGLADYQNNPVLSERYIFPYVSDGDVIDMRGRASQVDQDPKYKSARWSSKSRGAVYPFNWDNAQLLARQKKYLVITEGEIKAAVAHLQGFPCVALPGMMSWRDGLRPDSDWKLIVIFDSTAHRESQQDIDIAIRRLNERLINLHVARLPLLGQSKQDIDSFLLHPKGGAQRLEYLISNAVSYKEYSQLRTF